MNALIKKKEKKEENMEVVEFVEFVREKLLDIYHEDCDAYINRDCDVAKIKFFDIDTLISRMLTRKYAEEIPAIVKEWKKQQIKNKEMQPFNYVLQRLEDMKFMLVELKTEEDVALFETELEDVEDLKDKLISNTVEKMNLREKIGKLYVKVYDSFDKMNCKIWKQSQRKTSMKQESFISGIKTVKQEIEDFDRKAKSKFEELDKKLQAFADRMKAIAPEIKRCDKQECHCCMTEMPKKEFYTTCCSYKACIKCLLQNGKDECPQCKARINNQLPDILQFAFSIIVTQKQEIQGYENIENLRSSVHSSFENLRSSVNSSFERIHALATTPRRRRRNRQEITDAIDTTPRRRRNRRRGNIS